MRLEKPKNAATAAISQMSLSLKPAKASAVISASVAAKRGSFTRAPIDRDAIGERDIFTEHA